MTLRGALRSLALALVMITAVCLYAFRGLFRRVEELEERGDRRRPRQSGATSSAPRPLP